MPKRPLYIQITFKYGDRWFYHVYGMCFWLDSEDTFNVTTERQREQKAFMVTFWRK